MGIPVVAWLEGSAVLHCKWRRSGLNGVAGIVHCTLYLCSLYLGCLVVLAKEGCATKHLHDGSGDGDPQAEGEIDLAQGPRSGTPSGNMRLSHQLNKRSGSLNRIPMDSEFCCALEYL